MTFKKGCLISLGIAFILFLALIGFISKLVNESYNSNEFLLVSQSPNKINTIEIEEVTFFHSMRGPNIVEIRYENHIMEHEVYPDARYLNSSNFRIEWENDTEATIFVMGDEQRTEEIQFNADNGYPFELTVSKYGESEFWDDIEIEFSE
ncbi:hypothetical protein [Alkalihalobacterium bogoriense]|uniref:hypothetical protein n=1 Tax=Alkalihalobacterium bogoriense TaxID=246272 RepID=UPI00047A9B5E|nr:hypothetical protein [Alkalihalobacterium bogoriense]